MSAALLQAAANIRRWRERPEQFVYEQFGAEPDPQQLDALTAFANPAIRRISLQAPAGPGKTAVMAWCALNFMSCYGEIGEHPKGAAVSITEANLSTNFWPELAKWQERSEYLRHAFTWTKTRFYANDHAETWFLGARVFPQSATPDQQGKTLSGLHGKYVASFIDESGAIPTTVLRAAEQSLMGASFGKIMQGGNPISLEGMLYAAATVLAHQWYVIEISGDPENPAAWVNAPRARRLHVDGPDCACPRCAALQQIATYGRDNPWVMAYVLGKFPPSSLNSLLGPEEVQDAMRREMPVEAYKWAQARLGVDVARYGDDRTVIFPRQGKQAFQPKVMRHPRDSAVSTDIATAVLAMRKGDFERAPIILDATGGWAAGAHDVLLATGRQHAPVNVQFHAKGFDPRYKNRRAELYFAGSEWVKQGGCLPNLPELVAEATAATYTFVNGQFQIEPKDQIKERLGRSPDLWEAFLLTFGLPEVAPQRERPKVSFPMGPSSWLGS